MAVAVTSAGTNRQVRTMKGAVRDSSGVPYVLTETTGGDIQLWKGNAAEPTSFSEVDASNNPSDANFSAGSIMIESDDTITVVYWDNDTGMGANGGLYEVEVSSDTWGTPTLRAAIKNGISSFPFIQCAVDSNDAKHVAFMDEQTNMGTSYATAYYINNVGGSWNSIVEVRGQANQVRARAPDIVVDLDDLPCIGLVVTGTGIPEAYIGNVNNATSFTREQFAESASSKTVAQKVSMAVDSDGDHWVTFAAFIGSGDEDLMAAHHTRGASWTTGWDSTTTVDDTSVTGNGQPLEATIMTDGTDAYITCEDEDSHDIVYYKFDGSWGSQTTLETGTYNTPRMQWAFYVNRGADGDDYGGASGTQYLTYTFTDQTASPDVQFNTLEINAPVAGSFVPISTGIF